MRPKRVPKPRRAPRNRTKELAANLAAFYGSQSQSPKGDQPRLADLDIAQIRRDVKEHCLYRSGLIPGAKMLFRAVQMVFEEVNGTGKKGRKWVLTRSSLMDKPLMDNLPPHTSIGY